MWGDLDFSRLHITIELGNGQITVLNAKWSVFPESFPNHRHGFFELHYIIGGKGRLICEGRQYPLREGMLFLNAPNVDHEQLTDPTDVMMEYSVSFDLRRRGEKNRRGSDRLPEQLSDMTLWIGEDRTGILDVFQGIETEIRGKELGYHEVIRNLFEMLILKVIRNFSDDSHAEVEPRALSAEDRRKFIMDEAFIYNYRDMTLTSLSKLLSLSERQTMRNIRQYYGVSFSEFRQSARINAAARILQSKEEVDPGAVAEQVGFSSEAHFRKLFKERFGVTPREYRARHREVADRPQEPPFHGAKQKTKEPTIKKSIGKTKKNEFFSKGDVEEERAKKTTAR